MIDAADEGATDFEIVDLDDEEEASLESVVAENNTPDASDKVAPESQPPAAAKASEYDLDEAGPLDDANIEARLAELQGEPAQQPEADPAPEDAEAGEAGALFSSDFDELLDQSDDAVEPEEFMADIEELETEEITLPKVDLGEPFVDDVIELSGDDKEDKPSG